MQIPFFEIPIDNAPIVKLNNGKECIPQHYLIYQHTLASVQQIVFNIDFDPRFPIFVTQESSGIVIQIGIIGYDNYQAKHLQPNYKIVYGRKWRVEPELPTSEIIQTVFLALKVAREHEVRELFRYTVEQCTSTPFNNHHDLPLMAENADLLMPNERNANNTLKKVLNNIHQVLENCRYGSACFKLVDAIARPNQQWLLDLKVTQAEIGPLAEIKHDMVITLLLPELTVNQLLHELINQLVNLSEQYIAEHFTYNSFARFSRMICAEATAKLSANIRTYQDHQAALKQSLSSMNYNVDKTRVPHVDNSPLGHKIKATLAKFEPLAGIVPQE